MLQNFELFKWTEGDIALYRNKFLSIQSFLNKPINEENFRLLFEICYFIVDKIPFPVVFLDAKYLLRGRPNKGEIFSEEWQISYNSRYSDRIELGRFNRPKEPVFYAAMPTVNKNEEVTLTAALECYKELVENPDLKGNHDITFGQWNLKENFYVVSLCYDSRFLKNNQWHKNSIETFLSSIEMHFSSSSIDFIKECWAFFSMLASNKAEVTQNHFITTALFCALKKYYLDVRNEFVHGILYPSTMTDNIGLNVVLQKDTVDNYLQLSKVFVKRFSKNPIKENWYDVNGCSKITDVKDNRFVIEYL